MAGEPRPSRLEPQRDRLRPRGLAPRGGDQADGEVGVDGALLAPEGRRDWPLRFYSRERLFSKAARLGWVEPDLAKLPAIAQSMRREP